MPYNHDHMLPLLSMDFIALIKLCLTMIALCIYERLTNIALFTLLNRFVKMHGV